MLAIGMSQNQQSFLSLDKHIRKVFMDLVEHLFVTCQPLNLELYVGI